MRQIAFGIHLVHKKILIIGGWPYHSDNILIYDIDRKYWSVSSKTLPYEVCYHATVSTKPLRIHLFGGISGSEEIDTHSIIQLNDLLKLNTLLVNGYLKQLNIQLINGIKNIIVKFLL